MSKWVVHTKGAVGSSFEICVIRQDNQHGKASYGWDDPDSKRMISSSGGPCDYKIDDQETWDDLVRVAHDAACRLNEAEKVSED